MDQTVDEPVTEDRTRWWPLAVCLAATFALCWSSLSAELVYDDLLVIRQNPRITRLANWPSAFSATYWEFLQPEVAARVAYWRPLATLTHTFAYSLTDGSTRAFHAVNIVVHLASVAAAFLLVRRLAKSSATAFWTALLFGLHPINVESWAWVSALNGLLAGLFILLALHAHLAWRERGSSGLPWQSALLFALALLSKELAVAGLPLFWLVDHFSGSRPQRSWIRAYAPAAIVLLLYWGARVAVFGNLSAGLDRITTDFGPDVDTARLLRLRAELLGGGLRLLFWPVPHLFRPFRPVVPLDDPGIAIDLLTVAGAVGLTIWFARRGWRTAAVAGGLALLGIAPVLLRVTSLGSFPLSDRFLYIPTLGGALLVAWSVRRTLPVWLSTPLLAALCVGAWWRADERASTWRDEEALFRTAVEQSPDSAYVHWGLGRVLLEEYRRDGDQATLNEALEAYETAASLLERALVDSSLFATRQDAEQTNVGLGWCYYLAAGIGDGDYATAREIFRLAIRGSPLSKDAYTGLGVTLAALGEMKEAERTLLKALEIDPRHVPGHHNLSVLLSGIGEWKRALYHADKVLEFEAGHYEALIHKARAERELGWQELALATAKRTEELYPDRAEPLVFQAQLALASGDDSNALRLLDRALRAEPTHGPIHYYRGILFVKQGEVEAGIASWRRTCELMPQHFASHHNLGSILLQTGAVDAAKPYLARAYELIAEPRMLSTLRQPLGQLAREDPTFSTALGDIDASRPDPAFAERFYEIALENDPDHVPALLARANLRYDSERLAEAIADLSRAAELVPKSFTLHLDLGEWLLEVGQREEARVHIERARDLGPPANLPPELAGAVRSRLERLLAQ